MVVFTVGVAVLDKGWGDQYGSVLAPDLGTLCEVLVGTSFEAPRNCH